MSTEAYTAKAAAVVEQCSNSVGRFVCERMGVRVCA